ncbi:MAG: cytochrome P450, partial [Candidatus Limnocylindrus sp.]
MALLMRGDALEMLSRLVQSRGDIATVKAGPQQLVLLSHPDLARVVLVTEQRSFVKGEALQRARSVLGNGLLTSEGDFHLRQRRLVQPAFHRERIAAYAETMSQYSEQAALRWHDGERDMAHEMAQLTLAIAGKTLFDADVGDDAQAVSQALDELMGAFGLLMLPFSSQLECLPIPPMRRIRRARATIDNVISRLIAERRAEGARGDLLSTMIFAQDSEQGGARMDDQQLRDEAITIFLAGHETTANALSLAWYLL